MTTTIPQPLASRTPAVVTLLAFIALGWIIGPVLALGVRVPWERLGEVLSNPETHQLLAVTLGSAALSTVFTLLLGVPLALWVQNLRRGAGIVRLLVLLPLAMPPVVAGLALTALLGRRGVLAPLLDATGVQFAFTFAGVVASHTFIALPYVVVTLDSALRQLDPEIRASAAGVGLSPGTIVRRITLPAISPAIFTAAGLACARSLGEFGATLTFAGSMPGSTRTVSLGIYLARETDPGAAYVLSAVLISLAVLVLGLAALPGAFRRHYSPVARSTGPVDTHRLRKLTTPKEGGLPITFNGTEIPAGALTALIGPNGSGKSTSAGLIAGRLQGAEITLGGQVVDGPDTRPLPAHKRHVAMLTQKPGLPRMSTVREAVAMVTENVESADELLDAAGVSSLAEVPVPALSGGQAAQVALVRALAARPRVLILDEPLAAVDVESAKAWRDVLRATAADRTTLLITHDPLDIAGLSDHLVVMESGRVVSSGPTESQLRVPVNEFVAGVSGLNRLTGVISQVYGDMITVDVGGTEIVGSLAHDDVLAEQARPGTHAVVTFPPSATTLRLPTRGGDATAVSESARNMWLGHVEAVQVAASQAPVMVRVSVGDSTIAVPVTHASALDLRLAPGTEVVCVTKALNITIHPQSH